MKKLFLLLALLAIQSAHSYERQVKLLETSDVHGQYYPYDFINLRSTKGSLGRVATYVDSLRETIGKSNVVLLDNGDFLQGQPCAYYYNYIDTISPHLASQVLNYLEYDAATMGNHDIETGHRVYDRWIKQNDFPTLGANIIDTANGEPYLPPYAIINKDGIRIAVLGMVTPGIPSWLPEDLWSGLHFEDMTETAKKWIPTIQEKEKPDLIVGLFHAGRDSTKTSGNVMENASLKVAKEVPGFDIVFMGHDHSPFSETITNSDGKEVVVLNPANNANYIAEATITFEIDDDSKALTVKSKEGSLVPVTDLAPLPCYMAEFEPQAQATIDFVDRVIGTTDTDLTTRDAYFGPSAFVDFIHTMQLAITGAEVSLCAPLAFDALIPAGEIKVSDTFNLYKYENLLYTMLLTGQELKDYLEMSYSIWTNQMKTPDDHLLLFKDNSNADDMTHTAFKHPSYNFSSAAGIYYTVDVTKPRGEKINIISMADGSKFDPKKQYKVAVNSYRGNGGGNLMTEGAGIPIEDLRSRIIDSTDRDLRYYLIQYISQNPHLDPKPLNYWRFIPDDIVGPAIERDRTLLFGTK